MNEIVKRLKRIESEIQTARTSALRFYDDPCEVAHWYAVIDELILERETLTRELTAALEEAGDSWENRLARS